MYTCVLYLFSVLRKWPRVGSGDDTVGNPRRAQSSRFELFELVLLLKLHKQFSIEQFEPTASRSTVSSPCLYPPPAWYINSTITIVIIIIIIITSTMTITITITTITIIFKSTRTVPREIDTRWILLCYSSNRLQTQTRELNCFGSGRPYNTIV